MPLVPAKCTSCGAVLKVDDSKEQCFCEYCRTTFFVEKAINNYTINNEINIKDSEVHIHNGLSPEEKLENALSILEVHKNYNKAKELFLTAIEESPNNYLSWWGLTRSITQDLKSFAFNPEEMKTIEEYAEAAIRLCDGNSSNVQGKWNSYHTQYMNMNELYDKVCKATRARERYIDGSALNYIKILIFGLSLSAALLIWLGVANESTFIGSIGVLLSILIPVSLVYRPIKKRKAINTYNSIIDDNISKIKQLDPSNGFYETMEKNRHLFKR